MDESSIICHLLEFPDKKDEKIKFVLKLSFKIN